MKYYPQHSPELGLGYWLSINKWFGHPLHKHFDAKYSSQRHAPLSRYHHRFYHQHPARLSDKNSSGHPSIEDSLKDSLSQKNIYSTNYCKENINNSKYVLISKNFNIKEVDVSCNETNSLGQLSFGAKGKVYSKLSNLPKDNASYEINDKCKIKLIDTFNEIRNIVLENNTGYIYKQ